MDAGQVVKQAWGRYIQPYVASVQSARQGNPVDAAAERWLRKMAERPKDAETWAAWGRQTARRHCLHDSLHVQMAIDLDHRPRLLLYPQAELEEVLRVAGTACCEELTRIWPAIAAARDQLGDKMAPAFVAFFDLVSLEHQTEFLQRISGYAAELSIEVTGSEARLRAEVRHVG